MGGLTRTGVRRPAELAADDRPATDGASGWSSRFDGLEGWTGAALLVFGALLFMTAGFGRAFSKVGFDDASIYITELALAAAVLLAFAGLGPRAFVQRVQETIPLIPLGLYWLGGVIAVARGIHGFGLSQTLQDVGLFEYSGVLVVVAVVVTDRRRLRWLMRFLVAGGIAALVLFTLATAVPEPLPPWRWATQGSAASGIYLALFTCWVAGRAVQGLKVRRWEWPLVLLAIVLMALTYARGVWVAAFVAVAVLVPLAAVRRRGLATAAVGAALLVCGGLLGVGVEKAKISSDLPQLREQAEALERQSLHEFQVPESSLRPGAPSRGANDVEIPQTLRETFNNNISDQTNTRWRLGVWKFVLKEGAKQPLWGVGYGRGMAFHWGGHVYDARVHDGTDRDVSAPHNSFMNIWFRMGLLGVVGLGWLVVVAGMRIWPWLRSPDAPPRERAMFIGLTALFVFTTVVCALNVALEGPFMGLFFWTVLGLLLVAPKLLGKPPAFAPRSDSS
jgi:MFS family permease